jgi:hypothetical protein
MHRVGGTFLLEVIKVAGAREVHLRVSEQATELVGSQGSDQSSTAVTHRPLLFALSTSLHLFMLLPLLLLVLLLLLLLVI